MQLLSRAPPSEKVPQAPIIPTLMTIRACENSLDFLNVKPSVRENLIFVNTSNLICFNLEDTKIEGNLELAWGSEF